MAETTLQQSAFAQARLHSFWIKAKGWIAVAVIAIAMVQAVFPIIWLGLNSLKNRLEMFARPPIWFTMTVTNENYVATFIDRPFLTYMWNSLVVAALSTLFAMLIGVPAGYALTRFDFGKAKRHIAFWILSTRMMPPIVTVIPIYLLFSYLGLLDTKTSLVIAYTTFNLPFVVWMMKSYLADIPRDLEESAMVDGDTHVGAFRRVVLPLAKPGLAATAIFCLIQSWNEMLFALILTETTNANTLPIGIAGRVTQYKTEWGEIAAAGFAGCVPIIIFAFIVQRHLVRGLSFGAVKG
jgi:multiple sugar transport system permease protein